VHTAGLLQEVERTIDLYRLNSLEGAEPVDDLIGRERLPLARNCGQDTRAHFRERDLSRGRDGAGTRQHRVHVWQGRVTVAIAPPLLCMSLGHGPEPP
jgi:hypothetical protein